MFNRFDSYDKYAYQEVINLIKKNREELCRIAFGRLIEGGYAYVTSYDGKPEFSEFFCDGDENYVDIMGTVIEEVLNREGYECYVSTGCQSIVIVLQEANCVLKLCYIDLSLEVNNFILELPTIYQELFAGYECIDGLDDDAGYIYCELQLRVDCSQEGASKNSYHATDTDFRSDMLLATVAEYLIEMYDLYSDPVQVIDEFKNCCYEAFSDCKIYGELDIHGGNWGMYGDKPVIFDPIFIDLY